jgi:hypothetical protein
VVDPHVREDTVLFEDPINLFLFAPDDVPIIVPSLPPLSVLERIVDAILECGLIFDVGSSSIFTYGGFG